MAQLNTFKSVQHKFKLSSAGDSDKLVYKAPFGYTAIVLNAQCANIGAADRTVTFKLKKGTTESILVDELVIPPNDAANLATGKLVLQTGDELIGFASDANDLDLTLSFLETLDA